jgi:hypothetical protein
LVVHVLSGVAHLNVYRPRYNPEIIRCPTTVRMIA